MSRFFASSSFPPDKNATVPSSALNPTYRIPFGARPALRSTSPHARLFANTHVAVASRTKCALTTSSTSTSITTSPFTTISAVSFISAASSSRVAAANASPPPAPSSTAVTSIVGVVPHSTAHALAHSRTMAACASPSHTTVIFSHAYRDARAIARRAWYTSGRAPHSSANLDATPSSRSASPNSRAPPRASTMPRARMVAREGAESTTEASACDATDRGASRERPSGTGDRDARASRRRARERERGTGDGRSIVSLEAFGGVGESTSRERGRDARARIHLIARANALVVV